MTAERPLYLHISALSPDEYDVYTTLLRELAGPGQDDSQGVWDRPVDVMEARGWIRGRYGLEGTLIDKILRYFQPASGKQKQDILSAGQFFAVMRLVLHAQAGRDPAKALVFVQPNIPGSSTAGSAPTGTTVRSPPQRKQSLSGHIPSKPPTLSGTPTRARGPSDPSRTLPPPIPHTPSAATAPSPQTVRHGSFDEGSSPPSVMSSPAPPPARLAANPFRRTMSSVATAPLDKTTFANQQSSPSEVFDEGALDDAQPPMPITAPPVHPLSRSAIHQRDRDRDEHASSSSAAAGAPGVSEPMHPRDSLSDTALAPGVNALRPSNSTKSKTNPFNKEAPTSLQQSQQPATPPTVPPRRPPALPPRASDASLITLTPSLPPRPPKDSGLKPSSSSIHQREPALQPSPGPITSSLLIKESLRAAKTGQAQKASETALEKTLNWEVIKRSGPGSSSSSSEQKRQASPPRPPRRNVPGPPPSNSSSSGGNTMDVVAATKLPQQQQQQVFPPPSGPSLVPPKRGASISREVSPGGGRATFSGPSSGSFPFNPSSSSTEHPPANNVSSVRNTFEALRSQHQPSPSTPDRNRPSGMSGPGALGRSKSLHQTSPSASGNLYAGSSPTLPSRSPSTDDGGYGLVGRQSGPGTKRGSPPVPPPPPRRRPESFQMLSSSGGGSGMYGSLSSGSGFPSEREDRGGGAGGLSRHVSVSSNLTHATDSSSHSHSASQSQSYPGGPGPGDAFANLYESVKKKAVQPGLEGVRRMAERAEGKVVPGGYIHPRRGSHMARKGASERRGLVQDDDEYDEYEGEPPPFGDEQGGFGTDGGPDDSAEWREWDRTVRGRGGEGGGGTRGRQRLSTEAGMDDGESGGPFANSTSTAGGWQRL